jgi:CubicO group peptidase (beta-lactamase class C family)
MFSRMHLSRPMVPRTSDGIASARIPPGLLILALLSFALAVLASCADDTDINGPPPDTSADIEIVTGNHQVGRAGEQLTDPIVVRVVDSRQRPISDVTIFFAVLAGGGTMDQPTVATDDAGLAEGRWTIGIGDNEIEVMLIDQHYVASPCSARAVSDCTYHLPEQLDDGLQTASVNQSDLELARIHDVLNWIYSDEYGFLKSLLVFKNGKLLLEEYPNSHRETLQPIASITKSFMSALIGIALDENHIAGLDIPLFDFFPEYAHLRDGGKDRILLKHVLAMTSGFEWNESDVPYTDPQNDVNQAILSGNFIEYVLSKSVIDEPGTRWYYNSGNTMLLAGVLRNTIGVHADVYCLDRIFVPLGIDYYEWQYQDDGLPFAGGGLSLRSRDLVKFGYLYLQGGIWEDELIVPATWIPESTASQVPEEMYGYQWWLGAIYGYDFYIAVGYGGQRIINLPDLDMIIVHTSDLDSIDNLQARLDSLNILVKEIILSAIDEPKEVDGLIPSHSWK